MDSENTNSSKSNNSRLIIIGLLVLIGIGALYFFFSDKKTSAEPSTISGEIDFNGITPADASDSELGEIKLLARPYEEEGAEFVDTNTNIAFEDKAGWEWAEAKQGTTYELIAEVYYRDVLIKKSSRLIATAPAHNVVVVFNINEDDIPESVRADSNVDSAPEQSTVSGIIIINGYIPSGSTVSIFGRKSGSQDEYKEALTNLPASSGMSIRYDQAATGQTYEYQAELYDSSGTFIGQSNYLTVTAPASNEVITINSSATAPSEKTTIEGTIQLNGQLEQNSTVLLLQRNHTQTDFQVIKRYPANKSINFSWPDAQQGVAYDLTAALQVNEQNTATGNIVTITAPASSVTIRIDTNFNINPPTSAPTAACGSADSTNHYNAKISLPQVSGARQYYLEVGTSAGANNVFKQTVNPNSDATVFIPAETQHFARYAFTTCTDCDINDTTNWSGWSPTLGFKCPQ